MLERLVEQRAAVTLVLSNMPTVKNLNATQWSTAADMIATLRPFMDVTELMCSAQYPTMSMLIPVLDGLQHMLRTSGGGLHVMRSILVRLMEEKFGDVFAVDLLCVATVVDPRFKLIAFDTDKRRQTAISATIGVMSKHQTTTTMEGDSLAATPRTPNSTASSKPSIWAKFDSANVATPADVTARQTDSAQLEFDQYVAQPPISRSSCPMR